MLRERRYDIVHFAGHGRYDAAQPERSCWLFSDGPLYAFELRHTLANAQVTPWLIYGSACEGAQDGSDKSTKGAYHDGVYGMASAALGEGVAAYLGPLWKIKDVDAKNMAAAFYEALLMRRASLGDALSLARRSVREGQPEESGGAGAEHADHVPVVTAGGAVEVGRGPVVRIEAALHNVRAVGDRAEGQKAEDGDGELSRRERAGARRENQERLG